MTKNLYPWVIFFQGLTAFSILLQSLLYYFIGPQLNTLDAFSGWLLITNVAAIIGLLLLLQYFYAEKFWFVFATGVVATVCSLAYGLLLYLLLHSRQFIGYHRPLLFLTIAAEIVCAVGIVILRAKNIPWLKAAGALTVITGLILLTRLIGNGRNSTSLWLALSSCSVPLCFIVHFSYEMRRGRKPVLKGWLNGAPIAGIASLVLTLLFGLRLITEYRSNVYWAHQNYQKTKTMVQGFDAKIFVKGNDTLHYRLLKPLNYDPAKKYPLVICLPYGGPKTGDTISQLEGAVGAELLTANNNRSSYPAFLFIPNCPPGAGWGGIPHYPEVDSLVFAAVLSLDQQHSIDEKRRYIIGLSRGAFGAWNFICKRPDLFAAIIPVAGGGDPTLAPRAVPVAVWAFHGAEDHNAPVDASRNMIKAMKAAGGHPQYTEFPGEGHNIWDKVSTTPGLLDWLFAQHQD